MPTKKADKFRVIEWSTDCPYCDVSINYDGAAFNFPEEGEVFECEDCHKKIISSGWVA